MKSANTALQAEAELPLITLCRTRPEVRGLLLATLLGVLTALSAQASIKLPFSPVPITGQVLMALLAGGLLGPKLGALSQIEYLVLGAAGMPVFAGGSGGLLALAGPSGGYIFGFVAAAWLVGMLSRKGGRLRLLAANLTGVAVIYLFGCLWLAVWLNLYQPANFSLVKVVSLGALPFLAVDAAKLLLATQIVSSLERRSSAAR